MARKGKGKPATVASEFTLPARPAEKKEESKERQKIIVGVDYGTTFSGNTPSPNERYPHCLRANVDLFYFRRQLCHHGQERYR